MKYLFPILVFAFCLFLLMSCRLFYPNRMFKTGRDAHPAAASDTAGREYVIGKGDKFNMHVFANKGMELLSIPQPEGAPEAMAKSEIEYVVRENGYVRLPLLDSVRVVGMTVRELEKYFEEKLSGYYNDPFVLVNILNKRVIVFIGSERGQVLLLQSDYANLVEILAQAGGIPSTVKAYKIRIIRGDLREPLVSTVDLSSLVSASRANIEVQPNDIIYVEPVLSVMGGITKDILPWVSIITSLFLIETLLSTRVIQ